MTLGEQPRAGTVPPAGIGNIDCRLCGRMMRGTVPLYEARGVPASSCTPVNSREAAIHVRRGDISLVCCGSCGFIFNQAFDSRLVEYDDAYEDRQTFSPTFNAFQSDLVQYLVEKYDLRRKHVIEIGCGRGDFLCQLTAAGTSRGIGIDPRSPDSGSELVTFVKESFGPAHAELPADFFCCRHTLEHVEDPAAFLRGVREVIGDRLGIGVFFEVPNTHALLGQNAFWDIQYEHCSYFGLESISQLFESGGFEVTSIRPVYGSQYLTVEARPAPRVPGQGVRRPAVDDAKEIVAAADRFRRDVSSAIDYWNGLLEKDASRKVVIWGAGAKCQGFMSAVASAAGVRYVVDVNPFLHGRFMVGTGVEIKAPPFLAAFQPDRVIIMNALYEREIASTLDELGIRTCIQPL